jgi:hypothetical protein
MKLGQIFTYVAVITGMFFMYQPEGFAQGNPLFAVLVGGNEVNAAGLANRGDLDGFGTATANISPTAAGALSGTVCFGITVRGIDTPTAAHIHQNRAGLNGGVVVTLSPPATGNPRASSGCVNAVPIAILNGLRLNPANFYVNVHTVAFPGGALRGQLF